MQKLKYTLFFFLTSLLTIFGFSCAANDEETAGRFRVAHYYIISCYLSQDLTQLRDLLDPAVRLIYWSNHELVLESNKEDVLQFYKDQVLDPLEDHLFQNYSIAIQGELAIIDFFGECDRIGDEERKRIQFHEHAALFIQTDPNGHWLIQEITVNRRVGDAPINQLIK